MPDVICRSEALDIATVAGVREGVYRLLSLSLREPSPLLAAALGEALPLVEGLHLLSPSLALKEAVEAYRATLSQGQGTLWLRELALEYCRLFVGPGPLACPPYGSVYRDGGLVMGPSTLAALRVYQGQGLGPSPLTQPARACGPSRKELPDHVAVELEFMAHLCRESVQALDGARLRHLLALQEEFLGEHLLAWAPAFAQRLLASTSRPFYRAQAGLLGAWLPVDWDLVTASLAALEEP